MEQQEGKTVVTIRDVAQRAGVAVSTASRALSGGSASEATRRKVQEAAEALHFVPNPAARRLTGGHSNVVALVVDEPTDFLFRDDFLAGILGQLSMSLARENLLPFLILAEPDNAKGFEQLLQRSGAEGVVVASFHEGRKFADMLKRFDKPTVFIGSPPKGFKCPYVDVDNYDGGYQAGKLLVERGCRHIALIEGPRDMPTPKERTDGFRAALKEQGLERSLRMRVVMRWITVSNPWSGLLPSIRRWMVFSRIPTRLRLARCMCLTGSTSRCRRMSPS